MDKKTTAASLIFTSTLLLTACGGGSSGSGGGGSDPITGNVGDGYIQGAYVCHDSDADLDCLDETFTTTAADGSFTLSNYDSTLDLLVQIPVGAIDNGPFADGTVAPRPFTAATWYYYPAGAAPQNGPIFVGPLSTLVHAQLDAVPGLSVDEATNIVGANLGLTTTQVTSNYLESNSSDDDETQFVAELVGSSISGTANSTSGYDSDIQVVLNDSENVAGIVGANSASNYDTSTYTPSTSANNGSVSLPVYLPVADLCADLTAAKYFSFEDWDISIDPNADFEIKTLSMANDILNIKVEKSAWTIDTEDTSTESDYLQHIEGVTIDMAAVNGVVSHTQDFYDVPLPAQKISCNGGSAIFNSSGREYKLIVSEGSLAGAQGATITQGESVSPLLNALTFVSGDVLYKAFAITQNTVYEVSKGQNYDGTTVYPTSPSEYVVYEEGTIGGAAFSTMANTNDINALSQLTDTDFIIKYENSDNFIKLEVTTPALTTATGSVDVIHVVDGTESTPTSRVYAIETHNGTPFFFVQDYDGPGRDLFLGKIDAVDSNSFVYGSVLPVGTGFYFTAGTLHDGDIMSDFMVNPQARDRILTGQMLTYP